VVAIFARLDGFELDRELAGGEDPHSNALLAARAEQICRYGERRLFARRLIEVACDQARHGIGNGLRPSKAAVAAARADLVALAEELERPGPANPQGVARARLLLADGTGPLYPPARLRALALEARKARAQLMHLRFTRAN
jgi:hypothetical protein